MIGRERKRLTKKKEKGRKKGVGEIYKNTM